ncbi:hypothetical protein [Candidatus Poriferisodalis sp.]|uniref:hypothetical protein n=1 Tax=Candidatus Poriferisodalis sp. TaxID=3101277 RepID=UPI003B5221E5
MTAAALAQIATMVLAALAIVWHQQRSTDKVRAEVGAVRIEVALNGQRLARIEGYLGIGMPADAAAGAAGSAGLPPSQAAEPSTDP